MRRWSLAPRRARVRPAFSSTASRTLWFRARRLRSSSPAAPSGSSGWATPTSRVKTSSGSTSLYRGCVLLAQETLRVLEHGSLSQLPSGVDKPSCSEASAVFSANAACCAKTWSTEIPFASSFPSWALTSAAFTQVSQAPARRLCDGSTPDEPEALKTEPFSRPVMMPSLVLRAAPNGSNTGDSCQALPLPIAPGRQKSDAPFGRKIGRKRRGGTAVCARTASGESESRKGRAIATPAPRSTALRERRRVMVGASDRLRRVGDETAPSRRAPGSGDEGSVLGLEPTIPVELAPDRAGPSQRRGVPAHS